MLQGLFPFSRLKTDHGLPNGEFMRYNQLVSAIKVNRIKLQLGLADPAPSTRSLFRRQAHLASHLYNGVLRGKSSRLKVLESAWEKDTGESLTAVAWDGVWKATVSSLSSASLTQTLIFFRHHATWTPIRKW